MVGKFKPLRSILFFPPGWSLNVGNPHIALPLLSASLSQRGYEVDSLDLNLGVSQYYCVDIHSDILKDVQCNLAVESMNQVYFGAEDRLNSIASKFIGDWNVQLGFSFKELSFYSPTDVQQAMTRNSPFTEYYKEVIIPKIQTNNYTIVGFSIASIYQLIPSLHLCWMLRRSGYQGYIVFGGNTISRLKDEIQNESWLFDYVNAFIYFQGEIPFLSFIECTSKGADLSKVPHCIWRDGSIIKVNSTIISQNPNDFPTPSFFGLPVGEYWGINCLPLLSARGCYFGKCNFCAIPYGYGEGGYGGLRNSQNIFSDILTLENQQGLHRYKFVDEAISPKILYELPESLMQNGMQIEWEAYSRIEKCWSDKNLVKSLAVSGFRKVYFGLEILSMDTRSYLLKNDRADIVLDILKTCYDEGIKVHFFCMFGYPSTGFNEAQKTLEFILKYSNMIDTVDLNPFTYTKHTSIGRIQKIIKPDRKWALEFDYTSADANVLSSQEVEKLTNEIEDVLWKEYPRMLHPTYRMITPWQDKAENDTISIRNYVLAI